MPIDFDDLVAPKGVGPRPGQAYTPHEAWGHKPPVQMSHDLRRVLGLPRRMLELDGTERAETIIQLQTERYARPERKKCRCAEIDPERHRDEGCIKTLRLVQSLALREIGICGGLLGPIGVGHGKTLIDLLAPLAFQQVGKELCVLAVPPGLVTQLLNDYRYIGQHFRMPQIVIHGHGYSNTCNKMDPEVPLERGAPVVHVVPYSRLSRPEATDWLSTHLKPEALIADEAHKLRSIKTSATAKRVKRYMEDHPEVRFACWSGSITSKKIQDYAHLAAWALRGGSPLPLEEMVVDDWGRAYNPSDNPADPGRLMELCEPGENFKDGFRRRIIETIGVVTTSAPAVDCELELYERQAPDVPQAIKDALKMVRGELKDQDGPQRPDGEELVDALSQARVAMQVACGFYYKWIFPRCEFPRDQPLVDEWREKRGNWFREVRQKLKHSDEHLDSPRLVQNAAERAWGDRPALRDLPVWKAKHWTAWRDIEKKVYYDQKTVWLDEYLVHDVVKWALEQPAKTGRGGVVWYEHGAFGERVSAISKLPMFGGGKDAKIALLGDTKLGIPGEDGSRSVVCSIKALGTGTNGMQHRWNEALIPVPMSTPDGWEQTLGRLHRIGQRAARVRYGFYRHTEEMQRHVDAALAAALYVEGLHGRQKIVQGFDLGIAD